MPPFPAWTADIITSARSTFSSSTAIVRCGGGSSHGGSVLNISGWDGLTCLIALSSSGNMLPRGRGHESVDQGPQLDKSIHGKARTGQDLNRACFGQGHPFREKKPCSIRLAHNQMAHASVFLIANNEHGVANERVEGIADHHLKRQTPGIMSSLRGKAARVGKQSTRAPTRSAGVVGTARRNGGSGNRGRPVCGEGSGLDVASGDGHGGSRTGPYDR